MTRCTCSRVMKALLPPSFLFFREVVTASVGERDREKAPAGGPRRRWPARGARGKECFSPLDFAVGESLALHLLSSAFLLFPFSSSTPGPFRTEARIFASTNDGDRPRRGATRAYHIKSR
jgi:hypothetical protein